MNFVSWQFGVFLAAVLFFFHIVPARFRMGVLLLASYFFYATWSLHFISLILILTLVIYFLAARIEKYRSDPAKKRNSLLAGIFVSVSVLAFFKYSGFLSEIVSDIASVYGARSENFALQVVLPLGISFYTFEAISYIVDVYRGMNRSKSIFHYNFYIMYFPHLISGPIIRYAELMDQNSDGIQRPSSARVYEGVKLIVLGLLFKSVISDPAAAIADPIFSSPYTSSAQMAWIGALAFTVQIYFDFMGYTHIARGASLLFNIELPLNFNHPYSAHSPQDFWRRWHISLSRWIRDYLYVPLSGSRGTLFRTCLNLMIVMSLAGLWHGAGWTFLLWGSYHGALLVANRLWRVSPAGPASTWLWNNVLPYRAICVAITFVFTLCGWVLFRASDLPSALTLMAQMVKLNEVFRDLSLSIAAGEHKNFFILATCLVLCFCGPLVERSFTGMGRTLPLWLKSSLVTLALVITMIAASGPQKPFIYFQF